MGVVSLTTDPSNVLMWAHYAQQHRGFAVEFEVPRYGSQATARAMGENLLAQEVKYSDTRPIIDHGSDSDDLVFENAALVKSSDWAYENEHRVIDLSRGPGIHPYKRELLYSVIFGINMPESHRSELRRIVDSIAKKKGMGHLRFFDAKPHHEHYRILVPGHPRWDR
jgi:hypothetical protein